MTNSQRLLVALLMASLLTTACLGTSQSGNLVRANSRYQKGDYVGTIELADFILGQGPVTPEVGAQAGLLKAFSLENSGRILEAIAIYEYIVANHGDSYSGAQAKGRLAELRKR